MISNLNGSDSVRVHQKKKRFLPVRGSGSGSVRLPVHNTHSSSRLLDYYGVLLKNFD